MPERKRFFSIDLFPYILPTETWVLIKDSSTLRRFPITESASHPGPWSLSSSITLNIVIEQSMVFLLLHPYCNRTTFFLLPTWLNAKTPWNSLITRMSLIMFFWTTNLHEMLSHVQDAKQYNLLALWRWLDWDINHFGTEKETFSINTKRQSFQILKIWFKRGLLNTKSNQQEMIRDLEGVSEHQV